MWYIIVPIGLNKYTLHPREKRNRMDFTKTYDIGVNKPNIPEKVYNNWQDIVNSLASIADVPSALIMHVLPDKIEVASTSSTQPQENPYELKASEHLGCGLYCETVIKEKNELHVQNALKDEAWKNNPDVAIDMISYYGQPLLWPDNTVYGTICILDKKDLVPSAVIKKLLGLFRKSIENNLETIELSYSQEKLLQAEIQEQKVTLKNLNKNLEQQIKEEVEKSRKKDQQMLEQSRLAQMGEMISMIAHQWRQPLASISSTSIAMKMRSELEHFDLEQKEEAQKYESYINNELNTIDELVQNLTTTIDDFRNFYKPNKKSAMVTLGDVIDRAINIIKPSLINHNVNIVKDYNSVEEMEVYDMEVTQVILNLLHNAKENFKEKQIKNRTIIIKTENRTISLCDNGKGIPEDIIDEIFDPYFSTKGEKNGTGLGLYMSKTIIEKHHTGSLIAKNTDDGVCFVIELGKISENNF